MPSSDPTSTRLVSELYAERSAVWMSRRDRIFLSQILQRQINPDHLPWAQSMLDRVDAAPADPAEALMKATGCLDTDCESCRKHVHELLACLGCALPRNEDHA